MRPWRTAVTWEEAPAHVAPATPPAPLSGRRQREARLQEAQRKAVGRPAPRRGTNSPRPGSDRSGPMARLPSPPQLRGSSDNDGHCNKRGSRRRGRPWRSGAAKPAAPRENLVAGREWASQLRDATSPIADPRGSPWAAMNPPSRGAWGRRLPKQMPRLSSP